MKSPIRLTLVLVTMLFASLATTAAASAAAPANDNFAGAIELSSTSTVTGSNVESTGEVGEPIFSTDAEGLNSVWYKFVAPSNGRLAVDTCNGQTSFDTVVQIFSGTEVSALSNQASNDDGCVVGGGSRTAPLTLTAGQALFIQVSSYYTNGTGTFSLDVRFGAVPANDNFAAATAVTTDSNTSFDSTVATIEMDEELSGFNSIWYSWTAPQDGTIALSTCGSSFASQIDAFTGDDITDLSGVSGVTEDCINGGQARSLPVVEDASYKIRISGANAYEGGTGSLALALTPVVEDAPVVPPADSPAPAVPPVPTNPLGLSSVPKSLGSVKPDKAGIMILTKIIITCGSSASGACAGTGVLTAKIKKKSVKIGSATLSVAAGKAAPVVVKLNSKGKKALKKTKKLKASLTVKVGAPGFAPQSVTTALTLKS